MWFCSQYDNSDSLSKAFNELKESVLQIEDLKQLSPEVFLAPFLEAIRSEETTGPITSIALSAVNKFLSYGLIGELESCCFTVQYVDAKKFLLPTHPDPTNPNKASIVQNIADAVTHARFVGGDNNSDGVVLLKIVQVLRTLMLSPEGSFLSNESVCEIILSCFRICFETRLNGETNEQLRMKRIKLFLFTFRTPSTHSGTSSQGHDSPAVHATSSIRRRPQHIQHQAAEDPTRESAEKFQNEVDQ